MPFGNVFEKINSEYYQLTSAEKKVADYAVIHQQKTQFMSISELAEEAGVAEATISRFCKRLGYKGYSAFKLAVANSTARRVEAPTVPGEIRPEDSIEELCQKLYAADRDAMAQTVELIRPDSVRKAADLLFSAEKVLCMGQGGSMILAQECAHLFSTARPNFYAVLDSHMQAMVASMMKKEDVAVLFSYSGATKDTIHVAEVAKKAGAKIICVTRFVKSPLTSYADLVLLCGANEGPLQGGSTSAEISQLFLIDLMYSEYYRRYFDVCSKNNEKTSASVLEKLC